MRPSLLLSVFFCGLIPWIDAQGSVGNFRTYYHGIRGQVNILSPNQISIRNFQYDGQGPTDGTGRGTVHFWYGKNRIIFCSASLHKNFMLGSKSHEFTVMHILVHNLLFLLLRKKEISL